MTARVAMLQFHLDESVKPAIAQGLGVRSIDCTTAREAAWLGTSDPEQLAVATEPPADNG
jgi:hypothetical protein